MLSDSAARQRALDVSASFIVQAPAGSGKTELLIQRYLKLLGSVDTPDSIVAITFTRKAAGEMRSRVIQALRAARSGIMPESQHERLTCEIACAVLDHAQRLEWNLLRNPAQMRIETIDALCASITRRMPWLARFGAMPEISEKADDLYRAAARNTLRRVEQDDPALSFLLLHLDNDFNAAGRLIAQMLEKRDQWLRHTGVHPDFGAVRRALEGSLERLIVGELEELRAGFDETAISELIALRELERFPEARLEDLSLWKTVADLLLNSNSDWRKRIDRSMGFPPEHPMKPRLERLLARLESNGTLLEALRRFRELPAPSFTGPEWQAMEATVSVLALAVAELQLVFRESGRVDFAELAIRASEALGRIESPTDLALALGYRIQHVLVDEFQDTSFTQFELLQKLTAGWEANDGRTLFLVGDPMQSIYRFRQADVSLFLKTQSEGIGSIRLEPLMLTVNFRSDARLVEWVNQTFAAILPQKEDVDSGAVSYSRSVPATDAREGAIEVHAFGDSRDEAARVIELLKTAAGQKVAVLVRARAHLAAIVALLKRNHIRFQAIEIDQLGERQVIQDLMALTLALLHPADRVSWLAILRAPWCGLTLADLHALASADHKSTIWDLLHRAAAPLSADGVSRIQRILPVLEHAIFERGRTPLRDWVEHVWMRLGGPACVDDETALEDASAYFDLLDGLANGADLADFAWFREQVNALFAQPDANASNELQLMTIHKAKGLEFDCVILPGLGNPPRQDEQRLLVWLEHRGDLLLAPISQAGQETDPIYRYLSRLDRRKGDQETARLLYVAATRARRQLHLLGVVEKKNDGTIADPPARSFLRLLWPAVAESFHNISIAPAQTAEVDGRKIRRIPAGCAVPEAPPSVVWTRRDVEPIESLPVTFEWAGDRLRHSGTVLHRFLERVAREGFENWNENTVRARRPVIQAALANLGVPPAEMAEAAQDVQAGLTRTLRDPRGRWILGPQRDAECELAVTGLVDGGLCEAVIDRTFVDESGVRWIIDYKTSAHEGGDLEAFLDNEKKRYQEQLEHYARLLTQREDRPIRLGIYFPLLSEWREWAAPAPLRKQALLFEL